MNRWILFLVVGMSAALTARGQQSDAPPQVDRHPVMTWIAPYAIPLSRSRLNEDFGGVSAADGISHLALQFWAPTRAGGLERVSNYGEISDPTISDLRAWTKARGIKLLLCVYNGVSGWDWALARAAFKDHRDEFIAALIAEMNRWSFDGIDIDLEGSGSFDADRDEFVAFVSALGARVHAAGRQLTVDSFSYIWNAPNQTWWNALFPSVDALTSMGYEETGCHASGWRSYAEQQKAAGVHAPKLLLGMPSHKDRWQDDEALTQIKCMAKDRGTGVAIWDAQLEASAWRQNELWRVLAGMRSPR